MIQAGNLFADLPAQQPDESVTTLMQSPRVRIERIVSQGQASPPGFWYDQDSSEWVVLLAGSATIQFDGEPSSRRLKRGDYLHIPAHTRHRVEGTDSQEPTIWLAVHVC